MDPATSKTNPPTTSPLVRAACSAVDALTGPLGLAPPAVSRDVAPGGTASHPAAPADDRPNKANSADQPMHAVSQQVASGRTASQPVAPTEDWPNKANSAPSARQASQAVAESRRVSQPVASVNDRRNKANSLSPQQQAAIRLLLAGRKLATIIAELGIARRTLERWRRLPAFDAELQEHHRRLCRSIQPAPPARLPVRPTPRPHRDDFDAEIAQLERELGLRKF